MNAQELQKMQMLWPTEMIPEPLKMKVYRLEILLVGCMIAGDSESFQNVRNEWDELRLSCMS